MRPRRRLRGCVGSCKPHPHTVSAFEDREALRSRSKKLSLELDAQRTELEAQARKIKEQEDELRTLRDRFEAGSASPRTCENVLDLLQRHCFDGGIYSQEYAVLHALGLPTEYAARLRKSEVKWMEAQPDEWRDAHLSEDDNNGATSSGIPRDYLTAYGDSNTLIACTGMLAIDIVRIDESNGSSDFFSNGVQSSLSPDEICRRIETPTDTPLARPLVVIIQTDVSGGHAAGAYECELSWLPPSWLSRSDDQIWNDGASDGSNLDQVMSTDEVVEEMEAMEAKGALHQVRVLDRS